MKLTILLLLSLAAVVTAAPWNEPTLYSEIGTDPLTHSPFITGIASLAATGGFCLNGTRQSPIDITSCSQASLNPLRLDGHGKVRPEKFTMMHTGSTAQITYNGVAPKMFGGPLPAEYTLLQMHFHWGEQDTQGSEHAVNGNYGALEAHFVHFKSEYNSATNALTKNDGLAVFGVMFVIQAVDNPAIEKMLSSVANIQNYNTTTMMAEDSMTWMDLVLPSFSYYNYQGSLTTDPCSEIVNWIVIKNKLGVSAAQVQRFRQMNSKSGSSKILSYRREPQALLGRNIQCASGCGV